ncbi:MAG TPA: DNA-3-methyladenine glycosylase 2 family protein, partial [Rhodanobacteraceae bacterium]|nr:DNA-3-methyladenine glycosylase 2 family protein [Rhodanobacteraceae bacterium]
MKGLLIPRGFNVDAATAHLSKCDRKLGKWMRRIGPLEHDFGARFEPVDALARSILYQQLSGKAAATITGRVRQRMPRGGKISARGIDGVDDAGLRAAGVSRNKIAALRDLAAKFHAGIVPTSAQLDRMSDESLIEHLTQVRGIGRWTVEMLLMFRL